MRKRELKKKLTQAKLNLDHLKRKVARFEPDKLPHSVLSEKIINTEKEIKTLKAK